MAARGHGCISLILAHILVRHQTGPDGPSAFVLLPANQPRLAVLANTLATALLAATATATAALLVRVRRWVAVLANTLATALLAATATATLMVRVRGRVAVLANTLATALLAAAVAAAQQHQQQWDPWIIIEARRERDTHREI